MNPPDLFCQTPQEEKAPNETLVGKNGNRLPRNLFSQSQFSAKIKAHRILALFRQKRSVEQLGKKHRKVSVFSFPVLKKGHGGKFFGQREQGSGYAGSSAFHDCAAGTGHVTDEMEKPGDYTIKQFLRQILSEEGAALF